MKKCVYWMGLLLLLVTTARAQEVSQTITLSAGWNAFYLHVDPAATANEFFNAWPVDSVSLYDSGSFLRTAQYSTDAASEKALSSAYLVWHRGLDDLSTLKNIAGDRIYVCFASTTYSTTVYGSPCVQRMAWHPASTGNANTPMNFFGVSMSAGALVSVSTYLAGLKNGYTSVQRLAGGNPAKPGTVPVSTVRDGMVLVMDSSGISDWAGPLYVSPIGGIDFGSEVLASFSVRNDSPTNRTVAITYTRSQGLHPEDAPPLLNLLYKSSSNTWDSVPLTLTNSLAAGGTWTLPLAIDRTQFSGVIGAQRAGILAVSDRDSGSYFLSRVPVSAVGGEGATLEKAAWPAGLWLVEMTMDKVSQFVSDTAITDGVKAGGRMKLRTLLHVDSNDNMTLLQRVLLVTSINAEGTTRVNLHLSDATIPAGAAVQRLSTVDMGVDNLQVVQVDPDSGTFREQAQFSFTVAAADRSNPFRHAYHPDHDGLLWDFSTPAPSGDVSSNYVSTVKPETFSVSNVLTLTWSDDASAIAIWDPSNKLEGTCRWSLTGLRRGAAINVDGTFVMQRVCTAGAIIP